MEAPPGTQELFTGLRANITNLLNLAAGNRIITQREYQDYCQRLQESFEDLQDLMTLWAELAQLKSPLVAQYLQELS